MSRPKQIEVALGNSGVSTILTYIGRLFANGNWLLEHMGRRNTSE